MIALEKASGVSTIPPGHLHAGYRSTGAQFAQPEACLIYSAPLAASNSQQPSFSLCQLYIMEKRKLCCGSTPNTHCQHISAGKTTAVGMLSGLIRPSAGDCTVMGHSMTTSAPLARQCLGFCPQQNILFGRLTAREHLLLYSAIKGLPGGCGGATALEAAKAMLQVGIALWGGH